MTLQHRGWLQTTIGTSLVLTLMACLAGTACPADPNMPPPPPPPPAGPGDSGLTGKYVGAARCSQCHLNIHNDWAQTLHANALVALEEVGQGTNPDCLRCHTVGFGDEGGFQSRELTNSLAGVQCESCHGPAGNHANNASEVALRPKVNISSAVCGKCHTGEHQPNYEDWAMSKHAEVEPELVPRFAAGTSLNSCGKCHSGDYFYRAIIKGETVADNALQGLTGNQMAAIECAICHNPHAKTNNAAAPEDGRDYQLRYAQIKFTTPTTDLTEAQNPERFNLCGQCHHTRDRVWTDSSREPHPSDQVNVFFGEMPLPASNQTPIVATRASVHLNAPEQCSTCHVARRPFMEGVSPAISGHKFSVNFLGCVDCHGSVEIAEAKLANLEVELEFRNEQLLEALDAWSAKPAQVTWCMGLAPPTGCMTITHCWEFTSECGPKNDATGQMMIPDDIKKARYIYYYFKDGGGNGAHNPDYVREALIQALEYAENAPDVP
ncbi:MAG TPA: cytochrome c family protein [Phycisphaerae bacterium]|nr:cytochrome c family protein [Phycisphaerae bacterium]